MSIVQKATIKPINNQEPIIKFTQQVYDDIMRTLGLRRPECGGVLGSSDGSNVIDFFYFDKTANVSDLTYTPNIEIINNILYQWNIQGIRMVGIVHSHPTGYDSPSEPDRIYTKRILDVLEENYFLLPIVHKTLIGKHEIKGFYAYRSEIAFDIHADINVPTIRSCSVNILKDKNDNE